MSTLKFHLLIALLVSTAIPAHAASRHTDLDHWLANDLTPFVRDQLKNHPRFKGESLRFVVLANGNPQAMSNALALRIRDRLREAAAHRDQQTRRRDGPHLGPQSLSAPNG